jgi:hypothetical protein
MLIARHIKLRDEKGFQPQFAGAYRLALKSVKRARCSFFSRSV